MKINEKRPDFSGEWILNRTDCTLSPGADAIRAAAVRIDHRDPKFQYKAEFVSDTGPLQIEFELTAEEREGAALRWDGAALITTFDQGDLKISFRYELTNDGRRLRALETLRSSDRSQDNIWIFDRSK